MGKKKIGAIVCFMGSTLVAPKGLPVVYTSIAIVWAVGRLALRWKLQSRRLFCQILAAPSTFCSKTSDYTVVCI